MRRILSLLLSVFVAAVAAPTTFSGAADACACGAVMVPAGDTSQVTQENVLLTQAAGRETITMSLDLRSSAPDAGLVVPTPTPAAVTLADPNTFSALARIVQPVERTRHHFVGGRSPWFGDQDGNGATSRGPASGSVTALSTVNLGPLEATTLRADDPTALRSWLTTHGYGIRPAVQQLFDLYVAKKWTFVALKLTPEGKTLTGELPPVAMTFDSKELVHPLQLSRAAANTQRVRTYVASDHKTRRTDPTARTTSITALYAGRPSSAKIPTALRSTFAAAPYLTASEQVFDQPKAQITSDLSFGQAPDDTPYTRIIWHDSYLFSWDELVVLGLVVAATGGVGGMLIVRLRRRAQRGTAQ
ncbi:DUF2330 domain-containing protein [Calidifontibacter terrae]